LISLAPRALLSPASQAENLRNQSLQNCRLKKLGRR
jgi:hypothetical protein